MGLFILFCIQKLNSRFLLSAYIDQAKYRRVRCSYNLRRHHDKRPEEALPKLQASQFEAFRD